MSTLDEILDEYPLNEGLRAASVDKLRAALIAWRDESCRQYGEQVLEKCAQQFDRESHIHGYSIRALIYETPLPPPPEAAP